MAWGVAIGTWTSSSKIPTSLTVTPETSEEAELGERAALQWLQRGGHIRAWLAAPLVQSDAVTELENSDLSKEPGN